MDLISVCEIWDLGFAYLGIWELGFVSILGEKVLGENWSNEKFISQTKITGSTGHPLQLGVILPNFNGFANFCYLT